MTVNEMLQLWRSGSWDDCRKRSQVLNCNMEGWEYEVEGDWTQDQKYQQVDHIIKHVESGRFFEVSASRSGSYHTNWDYTYDNEPTEVKPVEKIVKTIEWVSV